MNDDENEREKARESEADAEEARAIVLRRRNQFVAAALAGVGFGVADLTGGACTCLDFAPPRDGGVDRGVDSGGPQVCLSPIIGGQQGGAGGLGGSGGFSGSGGKGGTGGMPRVCLSLPPPDAELPEPTDAGSDARSDGGSADGRG